MKRFAALLCLMIALPVRAALLDFSLSGEYEASFTPPVRGPFSLSYQLRAGPVQPEFADLTAPDGTLLPGYFVGTETSSEGIPSTSPETLASIGLVSLRFGQGDPLVLKPFGIDQTISSVDFNLYRYHLELWATGEAFVFLSYDLLFSPAPGVAYWDEAFLDALGEPIRLLADADIREGSGFIELSQLGILLDFDRISVIDREATTAVPTPGSLALAAAGILALWLAGRALGARRSQGKAVGEAGRAA